MPPSDAPDDDGAPSREKPSAPPNRERTSRIATRLAAFGVAALILFSTLTKSGIWDPYELDAADFARRIAIRVFGASGLDLPKASSALPTLSDLKMGELPFTSMALGFRVFGLHDWVGRLPLAVWALAGACVLYVFLERLVHRRAALYAVIALVTMPLVFMQARTMLGDAVTMAALTMAFAGLAGATFDDVSPSLLPRFAWLAVGIAGLVAGYLSRGVLLGVATPALGVGLAWLVVRSSKLSRSGASDAFGAIAFAVGAIALVIGFRLVVYTPADVPLQRAVGFAILKRTPIDATFDLPIRQLGHALFPWSAFLPLAIGRVLRPPPVDDATDAAREGAVRIALLVAASVAFAAYAFVGPRAGNLAFSGPALFAAIAALAVFDFERGAPPSRALGLATGLLACVLLADLVHEPDRALACFVVDKPSFPKSFVDRGALLLMASFAAFAPLVALSWFEDQPSEPGKGPRAWWNWIVNLYRDGFEQLSRIWQGNLAFALVVCEAALVGLAAMVFVGRRVHWAPVERLPKRFADAGLVAWWIVPAVLAAIPGALLATRDAFRFVVAKTKLPRASFTMAAGLLAGALLSLGFYPALAAQLSPKEVFEAYAKLSHPGEPLALLGVRVRAASYYSGSEVESFSEPTRAFSWLGESEKSRRWLVVKSDDLPKLNAECRKSTGKNLPVLDARSSSILLASNRLDGLANENPLGKIVLDDPPKPTHLVEATFEDQLETIGWDVFDMSGERLDSIVPSTPYHIRFYYRVLRPITGGWKAFVHIDGNQRRYNGDHAVCDGKYPMNLWQPGDVVVDELEFQLEPNFTPGDYTVYYGFFMGEARFRVTHGAEHESRVIGGSVKVR